MILNALDGKTAARVRRRNANPRLAVCRRPRPRAVSVVTEGVVGETYNIGGHNEKANIEVVKTICAPIKKELVPEKPAGVARYEDLITFVQDRPGHDVRYAIDAAKIGRELGWKPQETFESGIRKTVQWYLNNKTWWQNVLNGSYRLETSGELENSFQTAFRGTQASCESLNFQATNPKVCCPPRQEKRSRPKPDCSQTGFPSPSSPLMERFRDNQYLASQQFHRKPNKAV